MSERIEAGDRCGALRSLEVALGMRRFWACEGILEATPGEALRCPECGAITFPLPGLPIGPDDEFTITYTLEV
jgi:hypothetical protein